MSVNFNRLWKKARAAPNETEFIQSLAEILSSRDGRKFILTLNRQGAEQCIEVMVHALATPSLLRTLEKQVFFDTLRRLSGEHTILPDAMVIRDEINYNGSNQRQIPGGYADIKQGWYKGHTVAVKTMWVGMPENVEKIRKRFCEEVIIRNSLSHPNVRGLIGVLDGFKEHRFATVSEWITHGNIMEYIRANATNRLKLLYDAVQGLKYLHDTNLIHGDVRGANIFVKNDTLPTACLAGFGSIIPVLDPQDPMPPSPTFHRTGPFVAPELLAPSKYGLTTAVPTREADVYAFGLVLLQVLTGEQPFRNYRHQELAHHVVLGARPEEPPNAKEIGISNALWGLIQMCWDGKVEGRPQIQEVVEGVRNAAVIWPTDMPPSGTELREDLVEESDELGHVGIFNEPLGAPDGDHELMFKSLNQGSSPYSTNSGELPFVVKGALEDLTGP